MLAAVRASARGVVVAGRDSRLCDVVIRSAGTALALSRRHAAFTLQPDGETLAIADLGSTNGTYVRARACGPGCKRP